MPLHALLSPGGSPGVTTAAIALAFTWPGPVILAECDPSGSDVIPGMFGGLLQARAALRAVAVEADRGPDAVAAAVADQLVSLADADIARFLLPGITDPRQAAELAPAWPVLAPVLAAQPGDVIADCGRLDLSEAWPAPVLACAATVTIVLRPSFRQVARARPRIGMAAQLSGAERLRLLATGRGRYSPKELSSVLGVPTVGSLPYDPRSAATLTESDGAGSYRRRPARPLMRAAAATATALRDLAALHVPPQGAPRTAGAEARQ